MASTLKEIELRYELTIEHAGDDKNHLHLLGSFHPKYSIGEIVRKIKSITARELFKVPPQLKRDLWGGEFWSDGTVSTGGNWRVVESSIKNQGNNLKDRQLTIW